MSPTTCVVAGRCCARKPSLAPLRQPQNQRQQDAADFLLSLLHHVPMAASASLRFTSSTELSCSVCEATREVVDQATSVGELVYALPLPGGARRSRQLTLEACLAAALAADTVADHRCASCGAVGTTTHAMKLKGGRFAIFCLKRFSNASKKRCAHVACPPALSIDGVGYQLRAVVEHLGPALTRGHYVAYTKSGNSWHCFDRADLGPRAAVTEEEVRARQAYVVAYERVAMANSAR